MHNSAAITFCQGFFRSNGNSKKGSGFVKEVKEGTSYSSPVKSKVVNFENI
jgi:hypothetical protein